MWKVSYTIKDEKGATAIMSINLPRQPIVDIIDVQDDPLAFASWFATKLEPLISGQILSINATANISLPSGLKAAPEPTSDVEEGVIFTWFTADKFTSQMRIPSFRESLLVGTIPDLANANVTAFVEAVALPSEAVEDWSVAPTDARGNDIVGFVRVRENFKRSRRV